MQGSVALKLNLAYCLVLVKVEFMFNRIVLFPSLSQYGLVSWGPGNEDVGLGQYDVNTDIAYYKDWITGIQVIIIDSLTALNSLRPYPRPH